MCQKFCMGLKNIPDANVSSPQISPFTVHVYFFNLPFVDTDAYYCHQEPVNHVQILNKSLTLQWHR